MQTTGTTLSQAFTQWATRPSDQRFETLEALAAAVNSRRMRSRSQDAATDRLDITGTDEGAILVNGETTQALPSNWGFGQLARSVGAPANYLRTLPAPLAATNLMHGVRHNAPEAVKILTLAPEDESAPKILQAVTSPTYGRVWDAQVVELAQKIVEKTGGRFHNPLAYAHHGATPNGFGTIDTSKHVPSGLYASDRDVFMFLIDGGSLLEAGPRAQLNRGFFLENSEVGNGAIKLTTFIFNVCCGNNFVFGARNVNEFCRRHSSGAPSWFESEAFPKVLAWSDEAGEPLLDQVRKAQATPMPRETGKPAPTIENVLEFADKAKVKFTRTEAKEGVEYAVREEGQCASVWDFAQGLTAYARGFEWIDAKTDLERRAGKLVEFVNN